MNDTIIIVVVIAVLLYFAASPKKTTVYRKKKVVCIGDSLTYHTNTYICATASLWVNLLAAAGAYDVVNSGISGNTSAQMLARFNTDVIAHAPDYCIIECGGNDPMNWDTGTMGRIESMVTLCRANHITPLIMCCNPQFMSAQWANNWAGITPDAAWLAAHPGHTDYNHAWEDSAYLPATRTAQQAYCAAEGIKYIDIYTPMLSGGTNNTAYYAPWRDAANSVTDYVHPNAAGNTVIYNAVVAKLAELG